MDLKRVEAGSIRLTVSGSFEGYQRLKLAHQTGQLSELAGANVIGVDLLEAEDVSRDDSKKISFKARESEVVNWSDLRIRLATEAARRLRAYSLPHLPTPEDIASDVIVDYLADGRVFSDESERWKYFKEQVRSAISRYRRSVDLEVNVDFDEVEFVDTAPLYSERLSDEMMMEAATRFLAEDPSLSAVFELIKSGTTGTAAIAKHLSISERAAIRLRERLREVLSKWMTR